ncbi:MAG: DUF1330 domain-containing protein [Arenicella sp.]
MNKAYVIGHVSVKNAHKWDEYRAAVPSTLAPWGGELVFRGRLSHVLSGTHSYESTVVIAFPDEAAINHWFQSDAYQSLIPVREQAVDIVLLTYEADA